MSQDGKMLQDELVVMSRDLASARDNATGNVVIFNAWKNIGDIAKYAETNGFVVKDMLRWEKSNPMPRNRDRRFIVDYEVAVWLTMPKAKWVFNRQNETYDRPCFRGSLTPSTEKTEHTTQKPVWLMENILKTLSNEGGTVLDLFMGSGTTGVACMNTNRKFIGIEMNEPIDEYEWVVFEASFSSVDTVFTADVTKTQAKIS